MTIEKKNFRIAVLGGGPMGLGVAYELVKLGYKPCLYEADDRIGGMTACFDFGGLQIERFYHFHCTSDTEFFNVVEELGLSPKLHWRRTKMAYWYKGRIQPWGNPIALLKFSGISLIGKIRYGLFAFYCVKLKNWSTLDSREATSWITSWVGKEVYKALWEKLFTYKFYGLSQSLSAAWIWARIRRIGRSRYSLMREKLGYLEGGSQTLLDTLKDYLEKGGVTIKLNSPAQEIIIHNNRIKGVKIRDKLEEYDVVISTIPLPFIPRLIPSLPQETLSMYLQLKNVAVVCVIVKLRRPVSENFWLNVNDPTMDIPGLVEYSNLQPSEESIVYVPFYMPGDNPKFSDSDDVFIKKTKGYLKRIQPDLQDEDFIQAHASRYKWAQPVCGPNFPETLPSYRTSVKNLWVADTSHYYPEDRGISESLGFGKFLARQAILAL